MPERSPGEMPPNGDESKEVREDEKTFSLTRWEQEQILFALQRISPAGLRDGASPEAQKSYDEYSQKFDAMFEKLKI